MSIIKRKPFQVIYEDNHLIVVNKAAGVLSQADETKDKPLAEYVKDYIKTKYEKPGDVFLGVPHRLDRPVSGLIILARTSKALERMTAIFRERKIQKVYWAVVRNMPETKNGRLIHHLVKNPNNNTVAAYDYEVEGGQKAELNYRYLGTLNSFHLLEITPVTGRPHQIRVQLAKIGCPIRGDVKYGYSTANADGSINLHSRRAYFFHPVKKEPMNVIAGLPENEFWEAFLSLDDFSVKDKHLDNTF